MKKAPKVTFSQSELKEALLPTLMRLYHQDPESFPFRDPVDPNLLGIPDYFKIISKPMDMTTIKGNLDSGAYKDPWEYVDDVWLMFENAWVYNRKTSRVYKYCSKVSQAAVPNLLLLLKPIKPTTQIAPFERKLKADPVFFFSWIRSEERKYSLPTFDALMPGGLAKTRCL